MAFSTPESGTELGRRASGARRSRRRACSGPVGVASGVEVARSSSLWRDAIRRLLRNQLAMAGGRRDQRCCVWSRSLPTCWRRCRTRRRTSGASTSPRRALSARHRRARARHVLADDLRRAGVHAGRARRPDHHRRDRRADRGAVGLRGWAAGLFLTRFIDVMYAFPRLLFVILIMSMLGAGLMEHLHRHRPHRLGRDRPPDAGPGDGDQGEGVRRRRARARRRLRPRADVATSCPTRSRPSSWRSRSASRRRSSPRRRCRSSASASTRPRPSWGQMVGEGQQYIRSYWHLCVFPAIAIAITMLAFTFFGDGVRDALDPEDEVGILNPGGHSHEASPHPRGADGPAGRAPERRRRRPSRFPQGRRRPRHAGRRRLQRSAGLGRAQARPRREARQASSTCGSAAVAGGRTIPRATTTTRTSIAAACPRCGPAS